MTRPRINPDRPRIVEQRGVIPFPRPNEIGNERNEGEDRPLIARRIASFERRSIDWLWHPFIPLGMVTTVLGDGEVGKSTALIDIAARLSKGRPLPWFGDDAEPRGILGSTIILTKEDDISRIVRPRLEAAGADLSKVYTLGYAAPNAVDDFDPISHLEGMVHRLEPLLDEIRDVKLIVPDPITDFVGSVDVYKENQVRELLNPLGKVAASYNLAMVLILHFNKKTDMPVRYRGMGSVAFRNVPRSVLVIGPSLDDPEQRLLMQEKRNLTPQKRSVKFSLVSTRNGSAKVKWDPQWQDIDSVDAVLNAKSINKQEQAVRLLRRLLGDGPMSSTQLDDEAKQHHISRGTLKLAKRELGVIAFRDHDQWLCRLPRGS